MKSTISDIFFSPSGFAKISRHFVAHWDHAEGGRFMYAVQYYNLGRLGR